MGGKEQMRQEPPFFENGKWKYPELTNFTNESDEVIYRLLSMIGEMFGCSSSYVFEAKSEMEFINTYQWRRKRAACGGRNKEGGLDFVSVFEACREECEGGGAIIAGKRCKNRAACGKGLRYLETKGETTVLVRPIRRDKALLGFIGASDPPVEMIEPLHRFMEVFSDVISLVKEYRDSMSSLEFMSYYDRMTGVFNRNAFESDVLILEDTRSFGVVFCDISDLKNVNDREGHDMGDRIICRSCYLLRRIFYEEKIYRIGGDEFIVICRNMKKRIFEAKISELKDMIRRSPYHLAIGASWAKGEQMDLSRQKNEAEEMMYGEKRKYHRSGIRQARGKRNKAWRNF